ncbi:hypothetical protein [Azospirillum sp. TSO22-1]|uniref:phage head spike fiber domain-containing protein n=1 Tax=Azospirillum sp. TSO22-1 TaxID=716789 RepID=UPI000D6133D2|nr:hypothetical protein [Azospirillum sp. TSO22-1]PWC31535.1 hypothetical protein TSO221_33940 [Azospirillum sp. TSO22-1]
MAAPILLLDFARTRRFDRRLAFARPSPTVRAGTATPLRAVATGQPRLDAAGLLLEPAATNLALHGSAFDQPSWTLRYVSLAPAAAPDGSLTAWKVSETAVTNTFRLSQRYIAAEGLHTASVYAKAAGRSVLWLRMSMVGGYATVAANLADGTLLADSMPGSAIMPVGNGWYRVSMTQPVTGTDNSVLLVLAPNIGPLPASYPGDPACGLYLWGVQMEAGPMASAPVATGATAAVRAAESCSLPLDRLPRWSPDAGTLLVDAELPLAPTMPQTLATLSDSGGGNALSLRLPGGTAVRASASGGFAGADLAIGTMTPGTRFRAALAWNADGLAACLDGGVVAGADGGAPGGLAALRLGHAAGGAEHARCRIARVALYPDRLPDAALRRLTRG